MFTCSLGMRPHFLTFTAAGQWEKQCPLRTVRDRERERERERERDFNLVGYITEQLEK